MLDLYARVFHGKALTTGDYVVSADEKTSIQARCRCRGPQDACRARVRPRRGAVLPRRLGVHRAKIFGRCETTSGIAPFMRLVDDVMTTEPYASARRVIWVVDNGSSHRGQRSIDRLRDACDNAHLIHLPVHASWLNQIEILFSVVQRKVLTPNDFADIDEVEARLLAFQTRYGSSAKPFEWKFTRHDLDLLLKRLAADEPLPAAA